MAATTWRLTSGRGGGSAGHGGTLPPAPPRPFRLTGYGRLVRVLRVALPTLAVLMIGLVAAWPHLAPSPNGLRIGYADLGAGDADLSMVGARYVATDEKHRPYSITAQAVHDLLPGGRQMRLDRPEAEITLEDGAWVWASASTGEYRMDAETLDLAGDVRLLHDEGHAFTTRAARIDRAGGVISGSAPVSGQGPLGRFTGEGFRISDHGKRMDLTGRSTVVINPDALRSTP